jgi:hypothetical protein
MRDIVISTAFVLSLLPVSTVSIASPPDPAPSAKAADETIKCRKIAITGSLVKKPKVCKTAAEWRRIDDNGNRTARALAGSGEVCSGGSCGNGSN